MDMDLGNALGLGLVADGAGIGLDARLGGSSSLVITPSSTDAPH